MKRMAKTCATPAALCRASASGSRATPFDHGVPLRDAGAGRVQRARSQHGAVAAARRTAQDRVAAELGPGERGRERRSDLPRARMRGPADAQPGGRDRDEGRLVRGHELQPGQPDEQKPAKLRRGTNTGAASSWSRPRSSTSSSTTSTAPRGRTSGRVPAARRTRFRRP